MERWWGVLGDLHSEDQRLETALGWFAGTGVDAIYAVGDLVDGPGDLNRSLDLLRAQGVKAVRGNHERWLLSDTYRHLPLAQERASLSDANRQYLETLPVSRRVATPQGEALVCHGFGEDDMAELRPDDDDSAVSRLESLQRLLDDPTLRFVINGHSHRPMVRTVPRRNNEGLTVVNAGTLLRTHEPKVLIVDWMVGTATFATFESATTLAISDAVPLRSAAHVPGQR